MQICSSFNGKPNTMSTTSMSLTWNPTVKQACHMCVKQYFHDYAEVIEALDEGRSPRWVSDNGLTSQLNNGQVVLVDIDI